MRPNILLTLLAGLAGAAPAEAQDLGWLFGGRQTAHRTQRVRRHPTQAGKEAVPLPVPRPRFAGEETAPPATASGTTPSATAERGGAAGGGAGPAPEKPDATVAAAPQPPAPPPLPPEKPADLAPGTAAPAVAPSGATTAFDPRQPAADAGCADRLKARGVTATPVTLGPQPDPRCTVVQPMRLLSATSPDGSSVRFPDAPTVACVTADAFSAYVHDLLAPLAKGTWGVALTEVWTGPGLECRSRDHIFGAKLSAHGQGLAVDVAQLELGDGKRVAVGEPKTDAERDFETAARAGGCGYFHTALGPGSDSYHRTHWHFDLEVRGRDGDGKYCK